MPAELPPGMAVGEIVKLVNAVRGNAASILTAAVISAAGRPHSVDEALKLYKDVYFSLFSEPGSGAFQDWKKTSNTAKVHS